jgi:hypothetical protein
MRLTASFRGMFTVESLPMRTMRSPARMPATAAGVSSMGATTVGVPFRMAMTMPRPPKEPRVPTFISA